MITLFLDTEFTDFIDCRLISIGLVDESGARAFYAEVSDYGVAGDCSPFVQLAVLPFLDARRPLRDWAENWHAPARVVAARLAEWLGRFDEQVHVLSDAPGYDCQLMGELLAPLGDLRPGNLFGCAATMARALHTSGLRYHHALDDALALRNGWIRKRGG